MQLFDITTLFIMRGLQSLKIKNIRTFSRSITLLFVMMAAMISGAVHAKPIVESEVPTALKSWIPWVMHDVQKNTCPFYYMSQKQRICTWPTSIALELNNTGGSFSYVMNIVDTKKGKPQRITLPGQSDMWPQDVAVNGSPQAVLAYNGLPSLLLSKGQHTIRGTYVWDKLPVTFSLPKQVGIVNVKVNGKDVAIPQIEGNQLSLQRGRANDEAVAENHLAVKIFRKITDSIPQRIETRVQLNVSGKQREEMLGSVLSEGMSPLSITSALPARLDNGGKLLVQVRPGKYEVAIVSHLQPQSNMFTMPEQTGILPAEEIWSFEAQNQLRLVQLSGARTIDPTQTELPQEWRSLPAYLMKQSESLKIEEIKRGIAETVPDQLSLRRKLWLDFSGKGYTAQDKIRGTIKNSTRLEILDGTTLGSVSINGHDQYINTIQKDGQAGAAGIEVREGPISLVSNSRMDLAAATHPSGWNTKFDSLSTTLYLPPGWTLFGYSGIDSVSSSWISNWTLVDVFLVMITAVAAYRFWGFRLGALSGAALVLIHPELPAFTPLFLTLILCLVVGGTLKEGQLKSWIGRMEKLVFLSLIITALPFIFQHMQKALHPQLGTHASSHFGNNDFGVFGGNDSFDETQELEMDMRDQPATLPAPPMPNFAAVQGESNLMGSRISKSSSYKEKKRRKRDVPKKLQQQYQRYTSDTKVQTGYSQRNIRESGVTLQWNGSVEPHVSMKLWLLSAEVNLVLAIARVGLIALLFAALVGSTIPRIREKMRVLFPCVVLAFCFTAMPNSDAYAKEVAASSLAAVSSTQKSSVEFPSSSLLGELKQKLSDSMNQPANCVTTCATLARTRISISSGQLMLDLEIHAEDDVAVPLPGRISNFRPVSVIVNGAPVKAATVDSNGYLMVKLSKGISKIRLGGSIATVSNSLGISFPLVSRHTTVEASGWSVQGVRENGITESSVQFTRTESLATARTTEDSFKKTTLPAFYRVERTITLAKRWEVTTMVHKLNAFEAPSATQIPLLNGESVTSSTTQVKERKALISFDAGERTVMFQSVLAPEGPIKLSAPKNVNWVEVWKLNASNLWHVTTSGIPRIYEANTATANRSNVMPVGASGYSMWMPWPDEVLTVNVERPNGVEGATSTIDQSKLSVMPSDRSTDVTLEFSIRSSLGGQHYVTLPESAVLSDVTKNGRTLPSQVKENVLSLPLTPGTNRFALRWKESAPIGISYRPSAVNIGADRSVNANVSMKLPQDRWVLLTMGPLMGPAVLFWAWIPGILLLAFGLGKVQSSPLRMHHWSIFLLGISLSSVSGIIIMVAWVMAFAWREKLNREAMKPLRFNFIQLALVVLTLCAMGSLFDSIRDGLLGYPQMHIKGNGSYGNALHWYQDITAAMLPMPQVISVPIWVYRALMLLWALWLAFSLVSWLRWAWASFIAGGYWNKVWGVKKAAAQAPETTEISETPSE